MIAMQGGRSILFSPSAPTKLVKMGNITDVVVAEHINPDPVCRKVSKDLYVIKTTGEVKEYMHTANRGQCGDSLRKTFRRIREIINTNVTDCTHVRWVTLTYGENMTEIKQLYHDFEKFSKRLAYYCDKHEWSHPEYISVIEPQGRGAWHVHALFIWGIPSPYIPNADLARIWGHGFVNIKQPKNCDNLGAYFSGYLTDIPEEDVLKLSPQQQTEVRVAAAAKGCAEPIDCETEDGNRNKILKGARMAFYPPGTNIYRCSRGIKRPDVVRTSYADAEHYLQGSRVTYSRSFEVIDNDGRVVNHILKASYNSKHLTRDSNLE